VVTVLFTDVAESTAMGEQLDPESHRRVMSRYFDEMRRILERHGGTVEKFIGDAIMAVFGVPATHEDDALRAVTAAREMQERLGPLNEELADAWGVRLQTRTGINTGEVMAGDSVTAPTLVTGDAVNIAKRLEEAAGSGEILIGKATYPLVKHAVEAGPLETFSAKGKRDPVGRRRVDEVRPELERLSEADRPLVGRSDELGRLLAAFERAVADDGCRLFTMLGDAGVGKSRLARELCATVAERATTLTGRCLPYGEGITFWPLGQIVHELGGADGLATALAGTDGAETIAETIRAAIGASEGDTDPEDISWAVRRLFETLAQRRPLVVVLEDIHWAESTFLDLIEYLVGWARGGPTLLICLARPDLVEHRPGWLMPAENRDSLVLSPLSETEADSLLRELAGETRLDPAQRRRIAEAAEGNPLFVEQMVALLAEGDGGAGLAIPPTIHALLHERLDRLSPEERDVIERASVIGREFKRAAVVDLSAPSSHGDVGAVLMALVRKELIRPDPTALARDDSFRFQHVLVRDAAYERMPKELRADLHERFAHWIGENVGARVGELEEIVGYHLERAYRYREQLGPVDERLRRLAADAATQLASAGQRATARGDSPAAANLLGRALGLQAADGAAPLEWMIAYGAALRAAGKLDDAQHAFSEAFDRAGDAGDRAVAARATLELAFVRLHTWDGRLDELLRISNEVAAEFEAVGEESGLSRALMLHAYITFIRCRMAETEEIVDRALRHARRATDGGHVQELLHIRARAALRGPAPVDVAIERCESVLEQVGDDVSLGAVVRGGLALLDAMGGRVEKARVRADEAERLLLDLGGTIALAAVRSDGALVHVLAGDAAAAARSLRAACETMESIGEQGLLSTFAALLGDALVTLGDAEEARRYIRVSEESALAEDVLSQVLWRVARARLLARDGETGAATVLADEAVALASQTDDLNLTADAYACLGSVLAEGGDAARAADAYASAVELYEQKGNVVSAGRARERAHDPAVRR